MDRHTGGLRETVVPLWQFESLLCSISSMFPLANHFDLPGSKCVFGISQDFPMCAHASLSQDGFYQRGLWVDWTSSLGITPLLISKEPFCACVVREVSWLREWGIHGLLFSTWAGPSLFSQLSCYPCLRVLVHRERTQTICTGGHLSPASSPLLKDDKNSI